MPYFSGCGRAKLGSCDHACTEGAIVDARQASRSDRKRCLRHREVIARLLNVESPVHGLGIFFASISRINAVTLDAG